jgi:hypothetical protein
MTADKRRYLRAVARSYLSNDGEWFSYAPLGRSFTRRERLRGAWRRSSGCRLLHLPAALRHANAQYVD